MLASKSMVIFSVAPCGMNCGICIAHLRKENKCAGCNADSGRSSHCLTCSIKNCSELNKSAKPYCFDCKKYPCARLKQLDKRYRSKYGMSMIENLNNIKAFGIRRFIKNERERWKCSNCSSLLSVHRENCLCCGIIRSKA